MMKVCSRCNETKPPDAYFLRGAGRPGQVQSLCRDCIIVYKRSWRESRRTAPPRFIKAPEGLKHCKRCDALKPIDEFCRRSDRRGGRVAYCKPCWKKHADRYSKTPEGRLLGRAARSKRLTLQRAGFVGPVSYEVIYVRDGGHCWICWRSLFIKQVHFDHVIPLSKGGAHSEDNIRVACQPCNERKHNKLPTPELIARIREEVLRLYVGSAAA